MNGNELVPRARCQVAPPQAERLLGQHDDAAALGRLVGERRELRRLGQLALGTPGAGRNAVAWRLPSVIVPVLSSSSTSTSPAASTARPDMAMTLAWISRSIPAMPMAESRPPIVVGIRHTSSATSTVTVIGPPWPAASTLYMRERQQRGDHQQEDDVSAASRMSSAISLGVFCRFAPSTMRDHAVQEALARVRA